jgi:hypothetical protein
MFSESTCSLVRLLVVADIKKAKLLTSDDLKEVGNIGLEEQNLPQKAKRLRNVLRAALRSGTNPNQFDAILPDNIPISVTRLLRRQMEAAYDN